MAASEQGIPVRVHYRAPAECPSAEAFLDAVRRGASVIESVNEDEPVPTFDVTIEADGEHGRHRGKLVFETNGRTGVRAVDATSCVEASSLLAFATALAIGDDAVSEPARRHPIEDVARTAVPTPTARPLRRDVSIRVAFRWANDEQGSGLSPGVSLLLRRGLLLVGAVGDVGVAPAQTHWDVGAAVGIAMNPFAWSRVELLGIFGADAYSVRRSGAYGERDAKGLLPFAGARVRATVEVANVAIGVEGLAEANLGSVSRTYPRTESREGVSPSPAETISIGTARVATGLVIGTTFDF